MKRKYIRSVLHKQAVKILFRINGLPKNAPIPTLCNSTKRLLFFLGIVKRIAQQYSFFLLPFTYKHWLSVLTENVPAAADNCGSTNIEACNSRFSCILSKTSWYRKEKESISFVWLRFRKEKRVQSTFEFLSIEYMCSCGRSRALGGACGCSRWEGSVVR